MYYKSINRVKLINKHILRMGVAVAGGRMSIIFMRKTTIVSMALIPRLTFSSEWHGT
jgi:hypothetical protein